MLFSTSTDNHFFPLISCHNTNQLNQSFSMKWLHDSYCYFDFSAFKLWIISQTWLNLFSIPTGNLLIYTLFYLALNQHQVAAKSQSCCSELSQTDFFSLSLTITSWVICPWKTSRINKAENFPSNPNSLFSNSKFGTVFPRLFWQTCLHSKNASGWYVKREKIENIQVVYFLLFPHDKLAEMSSWSIAFHLSQRFLH